jgi:hypothetical protein
MTLKQVKKHWYGPRSESAKRSGSISTYTPKGGLPTHRVNSQRRTSGKSLSMGVGAGRTSRGTRAVTSIRRRSR